MLKCRVCVQKKDCWGYINNSCDDCSIGKAFSSMVKKIKKLRAFKKEASNDFNKIFEDIENASYVNGEGDLFIDLPDFVFIKEKYKAKYKGGDKNA